MKRIPYVLGGLAVVATLTALGLAYTAIAYAGENPRLFDAAGLTFLVAFLAAFCAAMSTIAAEYR